MITKEASCEWARVAASLRLDCSLGTESETRLAEHVAACPDCDSFASDLMELRERISEMPRESAPVDLAARVRARAMGGARVPRGEPWLPRVAAVVIAGFSLFVAFSLGRIGADREPRTYVFTVPNELLLTAHGQPESDSADSRAVATNADEPETSSSDSIVATSPNVRGTKGEDPETRRDDEERRLARAARGMLANLAVIDEVPEAARGPLLESQMRLFGLRTWVNRVELEGLDVRGSDLSQLAQVLREVETALNGEPTHLLALGRDHRIDELFRSLEGFAPPRNVTREPVVARREGRRRVVEDVASELSPRQQDGLAALLDVNASLIEGEYGHALGAYTAQSQAPLDPTGSSFAPALQSSLISAFNEFKPVNGAVEPRPVRRAADRPLSPLGFEALKVGQVIFEQGERATTFKLEVPERK